MRDLKHIDLNLLAALDALLDERNVTRAARRLAITQPTLSAMLARLRKLLGDPLFVPTPRGILPTPRAQALAPALKQWLRDASVLVSPASFDPTTTASTFSIAANDYLQSSLLVPFLDRVLIEAPDARVIVRPSPSSAQTSELLASGQLDISVTSSPEIVSMDLPSRLLYDERYIGVVRTRHPLGGRTRGEDTKVTVEQFCRYPHVLVSPSDGGFAGPTDQALARVGLKRRVALSVPSFLIVPQILQTGNLIAVVPERVLIGRMAGLRTFAPPVPIAGFSVIALWHQRVHKDPAHQWLRGLLATTANSMQS